MGRETTKTRLRIRAGGAAEHMTTGVLLAALVGGLYGGLLALVVVTLLSMLGGRPK